MKFTGGDDSMSFSGYGAVFHNVDSSGEVIDPGAFAESLASHAKKGTTPLMLLEHGFRTPLPIGVWKSIAEDGTGLRVEGELLPTTLGRDTYIAMKAGALDGLSIGYRIVDSIPRRNHGEPRRRLKAVDLVEVSVVALPANPLARTDMVKSADNILSIRDFENFLVEHGHYSRNQAKAIAVSGWKAFDAGRDDGDGLLNLAESIRQNTKILRGG
jgi:HK97 family phage prohead protease